MKEIITPIINKNFTIMAANKIYRVIKVKPNESNIPEPIFTGRIRDCKKFLEGAEDTYKQYGFTTLKTTFQIIIEMGKKHETIYMITEVQ